MIALQIAWFFLIGLMFTGYALTEGFGLGLGLWHLVTRDDRQRRIIMNSIGPVWDGNEVWLIAGGAALFAAFPLVYATVFSGFYLALLLLLMALIVRKVSLEFRGKIDSAAWRRTWDWAFGLGGLVASLLFGVAIGNLTRGLPLNEQGYYTGGLLGLLNPPSLVFGVLSVVLLAMHGAAFLATKTGGELKDRAQRWVSWLAVPLYVLLLGTAALRVWPNIIPGESAPAGGPLLVFGILALGVAAALPLLVGYMNQRDRPVAAFRLSAATIILASAAWGLSLYPNLVPALGEPERSLTLENASSTQLTLTLMLIVALVGLPIVLAYTFWVYRTFKGKVELNEESY